VSARIAVAVAEVAYQRGLATKPRPADLLPLVEEQMYDPRYPPSAQTSAAQTLRPDHCASPLPKVLW
jgi:hypothetical protein